MIWGILIFLAIIFLADLAAYNGIRRLFNLQKKPKSKKIFKRGYWIFSAAYVVFAVIFVLIARNSSAADYLVYRSYFTLTGSFLLLYIPKIIFSIFFGVEFLLRFVALLLNRYFKKGVKSVFNRIAVMRVISWVGSFISLASFVLILHGMLIERTNFKTEYVSVSYKNLPKSFDGLKIGFISDMHLGSFYDSLDVRKGIDQLMKEKPDIIFFGGDLVNNQSEEAAVMLPELQRMHAPLGMFGILGNHDVGDYRRWKTIEEKKENLNDLIKVEEEAGFTVLINQHAVIKKGDDSIAVIGVNSWGKPPFKEYGRLNVALKGTENFAFRILLTHNPSHWDKEVAGKNNADLTLSGHTHAMQLGINCFGIFWSPIKWMYPHWAGLYNDGEQYLYVNRGFGYLGFPGRIGMSPEITIITLKKSN
jgi:hypothetical protein